MTAAADKPHLSREHMLDLLKQMIRIRRFEEKCAELYTQEKIRGFMHLYDGEEAIAVGIIPTLEKRDRIVTTYREHGHALVRGVPMTTVMAEMYGKQMCIRDSGLLACDGALARRWLAWLAAAIAGFVLWAAPTSVTMADWSNAPLVLKLAAGLGYVIACAAGALFLLCLLYTSFDLNVCILHPAALAEVNANVAIPEIHGGKNETSMMLAIAPQLVRRDLIAQLKNPPDGEAIRKTILQKGVTWPWTTDDKRLADMGVIGDAHAASAEFGQRIVDHVVETAGGVLKQLLDNQRFSRG